MTDGPLNLCRHGRLLRTQRLAVSIGCGVRSDAPCRIPGIERSRIIQENGHAEHIHAHCDCTYAVRFDESTQVAGYDPTRYKAMYDSADGGNSTQKINAMRREFYAENREEIRAQQNSAYEKRIELNSSAAEEANV